MHYCPFDEETWNTINRHKALIMNGTDDFIVYIKHADSKLFKSIY